MAIDLVAIPTSGRPAALARCLASYAANAARYGRRPRFLICDDAHAAASQEATRAAVRQVAEADGTIRLEYVGLRQKRAIAEGIVQLGDVPPEVVKFAFFDPEQTGAGTYGANRNMIALHGCGHALMMVDDDTVCDIYRPLETPAGRELQALPPELWAAADTYDPSDVWPVREADEARVCELVSVDCIGAHERCFGPVHAGAPTEPGTGHAAAGSSPFAIAGDAIGAGSMASTAATIARTAAAGTGIATAATTVTATAVATAATPDAARAARAATAAAGAADAAAPADDTAPRVAIVVAGLLGDCGWGSPSTYLTLRGVSLARLIAPGDPDDYEQRVTSRHLLRVVPRQIIGDRADALMSTCFALDTAELLPPFLPICRGGDRLFGLLAARCCPGVRFAHLPLAIRHRPARFRRFWRGEVGRSAAGIDMSTLVHALLESQPQPSGRSAAERFAVCGAQLEALAAGSAGDYIAAAAGAVSRLMVDRAMELEAVADALAGQAPGFARDASQYAANLRRASVRPDAHVPLDLRQQYTSDVALALTQRCVRRMGQLLRYWPAILAGGRTVLAARAAAGAPQR